MSRTLKITHDKLYEILKKKEGLIKEGRKISKEIESLEASRNKLGLKVEKLKGKASKCIEKENIETGEFEYLHTLDIKGKDVVVGISDAVEDYKKAYRERVAQDNSEE